MVLLLFDSLLPFVAMSGVAQLSAEVVVVGLSGHSDGLLYHTVIMQLNTLGV